MSQKSSAKTSTQTARGTPRRERLAAALREQLLASVPGAALPSERELAARHGAARETVRAVLRGLARTGLIGVRAGRHVVHRPRVDVGTVLLLSRVDPARGHRVAPGYDAAVALAVRQGLDRAGVRVALLDPSRLAGDGILRILARPPAAVVVAPDAAGQAEVRRLVEACAGRGLPVVAEAEPALLPAAETVQHDHAAGAAAVTTWLIARGCRRILPLWRFTGSPGWLLAREQGYRTAMGAAGLAALTPARTGDLPADNSGDPAPFAAAVRGIAGALPEHLCRRERIDALLLATDAHAVQAAAALRLFGLAPNRDVLLAGYDATWPWERSRRFEPQGPAVTCDKDEDALAATIVARVRARLDGAPAGGPLTVVGRLVAVDPASYDEPYRDPWG